MSDNRAVLTRREAADLLGVSLPTLDAEIRAGKIPHLRLRRRVFVPTAQLHRLLGSESPVPPEVKTWPPDAP